MLLLLGILKRNKNYYMHVFDTENVSSVDNYQFINNYTLNNCANVWTSGFLSSTQNPNEYLKGEFDVSKLITDEQKLKEKIKTFQIVGVYYNDFNEPILYKSIDRAGNISIHDISEFEYVKYLCIYGSDLNNLPKFVLKYNIKNAYEDLASYVNRKDIRDLPIGLLKQYLIGVLNFKEGYHVVTKCGYEPKHDIHEYMLFNGASTIKLIEYVYDNKRVFTTKQDELSNPYPKERTAGYATSPLIMIGSKQVLSRFCKFNVSTDFSFYNKKNVKLSIPFSKECLNLYSRYKKSKCILSTWQFDFFDNISTDIYRNILPDEIYKLPQVFYRDMKSKIYGPNTISTFLQENDAIDIWIYTVSLFACWDIYSSQLKKSLKPIMENYKEMYENALTRLVKEVGPRATLIIMKWAKLNLKKRLEDIIGSASVIDILDCLFTFHQNTYELPEELRIYQEDTITEYGGEDLLKKDYDDPNVLKKAFIMNKLDKIEKEICTNVNLKLDQTMNDYLKKLNRKKTKE